MHLALPLGLVAGLAAMLQDTAPRTPREFGDVGWGRRLDEGLGAAEEDGKPVLLLFQEVPG